MIAAGDVRVDGVDEVDREVAADEADVLCSHRFHRNRVYREQWSGNPVATGMMDYGGSKEFWRGVRLMLPIAISDLLEDAAFGALALAVLGQVAPVAMSLTAFSGSAQFATVAVLKSDGTLAAALLAAASLNVRSALVAASMSGSRRRKAATCLLLTDAAWAVVSAGEDRESGARLAGAGATELTAWTVGTLIGVLAGEHRRRPRGARSRRGVPGSLRVAAAQPDEGSSGRPLGAGRRRRRARAQPAPVARPAHPRATGVAAAAYGARR